MLGPNELDVKEVMDVLVRLEAVRRCLEGLEDVANPNDVECAVYDVLSVFEDALDVHLVNVHCLSDVDLLDDLLALDVELFVDDDLLGDPLVLGAADVLHGLVVCADLVYDDALHDPVILDVLLLFSDAGHDVLEMDLVLLILDGCDALLDVDHLIDVSLGDPDVDLVEHTQHPLPHPACHLHRPHTVHQHSQVDNILYLRQPLLHSIILEYISITWQAENYEAFVYTSSSPMT